MAKQITIGGSKAIIVNATGGPVTVNATVPPPAPSDKLIFEETLEGATYFPLTGSAINKTYAIENCGTDWTLSRVTDIVFSGGKAARFEIRKDQPGVGGGGRIRSEVTGIKGSTDSRFTPEIWYSYAIYFPSDGMQSDASHDTISQWYEDGGNDCTVKLRNGKAYFEMIHPTTSALNRFDLFGAINSAPTTSTGTVSSSFTDIPRDTWHEFAFHFIHSQTSGGLVEIWRDGVKIQTINGRNMHTAIYPKSKFGLYKSDYTSDPSASTADYRILYFDNVRIGKADATISDMISV
jgi:hypothetical protein